MIPKEFDAVIASDIEALVTNAVAEGRTIEFKQQLPGGSDDDKREFLADFSSLANAAGGDLIYGVIEKRDENGKPTGIPEKAEGLASINADAEIRRLDEIIRSGIDPRVPGYRIRKLDGFASGPIIIIRTPKSWASPHMVIFKNLSRFYSRTSAGKYQLDVREIRSAFTASGDLRTKITSFRSERIGKIIANEAPIDLPATPKIILHLVPLSIVDPATQLDLTPLSDDPNLAAPIYNQSFDTRINFDGYLSFNANARGGRIGYVQVFRSGAFEATDVDILQQSNTPKIIATGHIEQTLRDATSRYVKAMKQIGVPLPVILMVTILGIKGYGMVSRKMWQQLFPKHTVDRDTLMLPDALLEDFNTPADVALRPIFDSFWQSAGFPGSENYNQQGRWDGGLSVLQS